MQKKAIILLAILAVVIIGGVVAANYYNRSVQTPVTPTANSALVRDDSPTQGPTDAKVTLVEFLDPECESCAAFHPKVKAIMKENEGKIRLVVRYMPLHPNSNLAATYTEAAGEQGKYWQMQDLLFTRQGEWGTRHGHGNQPQPDAKAFFEKAAMELGLDLEKINAAIKENRYAAKLGRDRQDGASLGVSRTPTFFVNGRQLAQFGEAPLRALIAEEMNK